MFRRSIFQGDFLLQSGWFTWLLVLAAPAILFGLALSISPEDTVIENGALAFGRAVNQSTAGLPFSPAAGFISIAENR